MQAFSRMAVAMVEFVGPCAISEPTALVSILIRAEMRIANIVKKFITKRLGTAKLILLLMIGEAAPGDFTLHTG